MVRTAQGQRSVAARSVTNGDPEARSLILHRAAFFSSDTANTFGHGYSLVNAGVNEPVDFRALWLTL
jgi:hypothetical protein